MPAIIEPMWATEGTENNEILENTLPLSKRQNKGLAATELMKPTHPGNDRSFISQKFSAGTVTKKDELEDRLVGLISTKDRELLALAEKN